jgi:hypothetical protein
MRKLRRGLFLGVVLLVSVLSWSTLGLAVEIFPLEGIRPGLRGIGKTVIAGNTIEDFDVEVLGLVPQSPPLSNLILIKVSGGVIDKAGGIAQGMSGSPVYVQGKLLGALGYTFAYTDHRLGLVTPAGDMFKLYDQLAPVEALPEPELPEDAAPVSSPLLIQGLNRRNTEYLTGALTKTLSPYEVQVLPALAANTPTFQAPLQPGSMVGVQLLRGDFQVASFGTVTHVQEDGRFIAFGHPFTHRGEVDFFASTAYVHYTLANLEMPYKITSLGSTVGSVRQDRTAGLGGSLGLEPTYIPITIVVHDQDSGHHQDYYVEVVKQGDIMIPLVISSAYQSVDATLDRVGEGTSFVRLEFTTGNLSQRMIRENLFYSDTDIAVWSLTDLLAGLELLMNNSVQEVDLQQIKVDVEVAQTRKTATIEKATPNKFNVRPGEYVDVEVSIRPYRSPAETRILRLQIPQETTPGLLTVTVRGGGAGYYVVKPPVHTSILTQSEDDDEPIRAVVSGAETLDALVTEYMDRERNNEIVAEFYPFLENYEEDSHLDDGDEDLGEPINLYGWADGSPEVNRVRLSTQFVMDGMATFDLNIY